MQIRFKSFGPLRRMIGKPEVPLELSKNATVNDAIHMIIRQNGTKVENLLLESGKLSGNLIVLVNKTDIDLLDGIMTRLSPDDELTILPHVQGG